ncbi:hypothetical protein C1645_839773 [Glomus cerebriforme]|uniref:Uncharacterized protein n=1 Tax=Glomus cerebriforme TaxID=658196 RepID=A0A397SAV1_9GLOM|nr:hypothetical protein C1645_839773 [Glomus cerebriforme]
MEKCFALFKNFLNFSEQDKLFLAKHTLLLISNLDLSIARFIGLSEPSTILQIWIIRTLLQAQEEKIQNIKLSFSSPDFNMALKTSKIVDTNNINNMISTNPILDNTNCDNNFQLRKFSLNGLDSHINNLNDIDALRDDPIKHYVHNNSTRQSDTVTLPSHDSDPSRANIFVPSDHLDDLMQDVIKLKPLVLHPSSNNIVTTMPPSLNPSPAENSTIPMDTSFSNDSLIKKSNQKKKKNSTQQSTLVNPLELAQPQVPIDTLIDISEHSIPVQEELTLKDNDLAQSILIPPEIMDITFNEIINKSIDIIIDQLDSTHLSEALPNIMPDQPITRYSPTLSSTGILDKSHSFIPSPVTSPNADSPVRPLSFDTCVAVQQAQVAIRKDPCIKHIKAIKYKREYLKSIKAEEAFTNRSQYALSSPLEYTYDGYISVDDIKQDSSINNHEKLLAFIELFMCQFEHFSSNGKRQGLL